MNKAGGGSAGNPAEGNPLVLQSRSQAEAAPLKFPPFNVPQPMPLSQSDRELTERSRFLQETLKYSGYYVVPSPSSTRLLQAHSLVSSAFSSSSDPSTATNTAADGTEAAPPVQQIYTPQLERYSDRYRKILGKKTFYDEIPTPNPHLFPPELLSSKHQIHFVSTFSSKVQFLSSKTLANEVARLVAAHASVPVNEVGGERMNVSGSGAGANGSGGDAAAGLEADERQEKEEEEDEDAQQQGEMQDESDQEDGGDYVNEYGDDDEDGGGDAFGDDGDEGETM